MIKQTPLTEKRAIPPQGGGNEIAAHPYSGYGSVISLDEPIKIMTEATAAARLPEAPNPIPDATQVTAFLQKHPDFLSHHVADTLRTTLENLLANDPSLIADLTLPRPPEGVASLPHVQLRLWRERLARLEHKISALHDTAKNNAQLDQVMHDFALTLLQSDCRTPAALSRSLHAHFPLDAVRIIPVADLKPDQSAPLQGWLSSGMPLCGRLNDQQRRVLFEADFPETGSVALMALPIDPAVKSTTDLAKIGFILALGRHAPDGFNPSQGTLFLQQIGQLAGVFLSGHHPA